MKIWIRNQWYTLPVNLLIVHLSDQDKANIANMPSECHIYAKFDEETFDPKAVKKLLKRLKKEVENGI